MSETQKNYRVSGFPQLAIAVGVWWFIWGHYGFWWGVLYGLGWPAWVGYRIAQYLVTP